VVGEVEVLSDSVEAAMKVESHCSEHSSHSEVQNSPKRYRHRSYSYDGAQEDEYLAQDLDLPREGRRTTWDVNDSWFQRRPVGFRVDPFISVDPARRIPFLEVAGATGFIASSSFVHGPITADLISEQPAHVARNVTEIVSTTPRETSHSGFPR